MEVSGQLKAPAALRRDKCLRYTMDKEPVWMGCRRFRVHAGNCTPVIQTVDTLECAIIS